MNSYFIPAQWIQILAFIEMLLFFSVVSALYFFIVPAVYFALVALIQWRQATLAHVQAPWTWLGQLPIWMTIITGAGYVGLVALYWSPGDRRLDKAELLAGLILLCAAVVGVAIWQWDAVSALWKWITT